MRVYLVEDSPVVARRLERIITELCAAEVIGCAAEARPAIADIERLKPDAIVVDLSLKCGNGFEVLEAVCYLPVQPLTIVLTNFPTSQYREAARALGAHHFFDKSTEFEQVVAVISDSGGVPR